MDLSSPNLCHSAESRATCCRLPHYAKTLEHWSDRLEERLSDAAKLLDQKTLRIWRVYLMGSSYGFAQGWMNIYQILASRQTRGGGTDLPWTREHMYPEHAAG